ncbi:MAG TPA: autotransporter-associated beta strand repeat-containing protein [Tepidisphaeraceae bacterium]|nr:autotransporter-associated beta strand repeat-containing protein [Tepidisphaeraceae bacterium]
MMSRLIRPRRTRTLLAATLLFPSLAPAATGTWTNPATSGTWSTTSNWSAGIIADGANSTANFSTLDLTADNTVHLNTSRTLGSLLFADTTPTNNWTLDNNGAANTLTLSTTTGTPSITVSNQTATLSLALTSSQIVTKSGAGTLSLAGTLDNAGIGFNVTAGNLLLAKTSTSTVHAIGLGGLNISSGATVTLAGTGNDQIYDFAPVTVSAGGTFDVNNHTESFSGFSVAGTLTNSATTAAGLFTFSSLTLAAGASISIPNPHGDLALSGPITGSAPLIKNGPGILELYNSTSTPNSLTGPVNLNDGTLYAYHASPYPNAASLNIGDGTGATASAQLYETVATTSRSTGIPVNINTDGFAQFVGDTLGPITMTGGEIAPFGITLTSDITVNSSPHTSTFEGFTGNITLSDINNPNHTFTVAKTTDPSGIDLEIDAPFNEIDSNSITKAGPGTLLLTASNAFTGGVTLSAGTLYISNDQSLGAGTLTLAGGTLRLDASSHTLSNYVHVTSPSTITNDAPLTLTNTLDGTAPLTKTGTGPLTLTGFNNLIAPFTISAGSLILNTGLASPTLTNNATLVYNAGPISGRLINAGVLTLNADLSLPNGLENDSSFTLPAGRSLSLAGAGLDNQGTLTLAAGSFLTLSPTSPNSNSGNFNLPDISSFNLGPASLTNTGTITLNSSLLSATTGSLTNNPGGVLRGPGNITAPLANPGGTLLADAGTTRLANPLSSSGLILLSSPASSLTGSPITSTGTIQGLGSISNQITNAGTLEPTGGTLTLSSPLVSSSTGIIRTSSGTKLLLLQGLATNSGLISLTGGTLDNANNPLNNTGSITGYGTLASSSLTNNGSITLAGGTTTINGPVTNPTSHTIEVRYSSAVFTHPVTNSGTITLTSGNVTFAAGLAGSAPSSPSSISLDAPSSATTPYIRQSTLTSSGSLSLLPQSQGGQSSSLDTLTLTPTASFDLADNNLTITSISSSTLRTDLLTHELFSSTADADPQHLLALGYSDSTPTLITLTTYGDANLDGKINADDYALLDRGFAKHLSSWQSGDFNYDGVINSADYLLIDRTFLLSQAPGFSPGSLLSQRESQFGPLYVQQLLTSLPDPSLSSILYPLSTLFFLRRRISPKNMSSSS